jgi:hydroxymethylbilane synthase
MRLGTRTSRLALAQSGQVAAALGPDVELVGMQTSGDKVVDAPLRGPLAKGWFTEELEAALLEGRIDLAVHSLKDLPLQVRPGLVVAAIPPREPAEDLLLVRDPVGSGPVLPLPEGARVGSSAARRQALFRALRPDLDVRELRGNVTTRLDRLAEGRFDAIVLAEAGLRRLDLLRGATAAFRVVRLRPEVWPSAPGQGALAVQCRAEDVGVVERIAALHHPPTAVEVETERRWLGAMGGGCSVPFGARVRGRRWSIGLDAGAGFRVRRSGDASEALAGLLAGGPGEAWSGELWEAV